MLASCELLLLLYFCVFTANPIVPVSYAQDVEEPAASEKQLSGKGTLLPAKLPSIIEAREDVTNEEGEPVAIEQPPPALLESNSGPQQTIGKEKTQEDDQKEKADKEEDPDEGEEEEEQEHEKQKDQGDNQEEEPEERRCRLKDFPKAEHFREWEKSHAQREENLKNMWAKALVQRGAFDEHATTFTKNVNDHKMVFAGHELTLSQLALKFSSLLRDTSRDSFMYDAKKFDEVAQYGIHLQQVFDLHQATRDADIAGSVRLCQSELCPGQCSYSCRQVPYVHRECSNQKYAQLDEPQCPEEYLDYKAIVRYPAFTLAYPIFSSMRDKQDFLASISYMDEARATRECLREMLEPEEYQFCKESIVIRELDDRINVVLGTPQWVRGGAYAVRGGEWPYDMKDGIAVPLTCDQAKVDDLIPQTTLAEKQPQYFRLIPLLNKLSKEYLSSHMMFLDTRTLMQILQFKAFMEWYPTITIALPYEHRTKPTFEFVEAWLWHLTHQSEYCCNKIVWVKSEELTLEEEDDPNVVSARELTAAQTIYPCDIPVSHPYFYQVANDRLSSLSYWRPWMETRMRTVVLFKDEAQRIVNFDELVDALERMVNATRNLKLKIVPNSPNFWRHLLPEAILKEMPLSPTLGDLVSFMHLQVSIVIGTRPTLSSWILALSQKAAIVELYVPDQDEGEFPDFLWHVSEALNMRYFIVPIESSRGTRLYLDVQKVISMLLIQHQSFIKFKARRLAT